MVDVVQRTYNHSLLELPPPLPSDWSRALRKRFNKAAAAGCADQVLALLRGPRLVRT